MTFFTFSNQERYLNKLFFLSKLLIKVASTSLRHNTVEDAMGNTCLLITGFEDRDRTFLKRGELLKVKQVMYQKLWVLFIIFVR